MTQPDTQGRLPLAARLAAALVAYNGRIPVTTLRHIATTAGITGSVPHPNGHGSHGSRASQAVYHAMRILRRDGLVERDGNEYVAVDMLDLLDWLAESLDDTVHARVSRAEHA